MLLYLWTLLKVEKWLKLRFEKEKNNNFTD